MGSFNVALLEALLSAGVSNDRARAVVDLFDRALDERYGLHAQVLATKRDVAEHGSALGRDIAALDARVSREIAELDSRVSRKIAELENRVSREISETKVLVSQSKADLVKWTLAALTAQTALLLGAIKLF